MNIRGDKMPDNKTVWIIGAVLIIVVLFGLGSFDRLVGAQTKDTPSPRINAHECRADDVCEVKTRIESASGFPITLSSDSGSAKIEGDLTLTKQGQSGGVVFKTNEPGSLTITPQSGFAKLEGQLTITGLGDYSGTILRQNPGGSFEIITASGTSPVKIDNTLQIGSLSSSDGRAFVCVNGEGLLYRSNASCR